jgi:hypothetical protein
VGKVLPSWVPFEIWLTVDKRRGDGGVTQYETSATVDNQGQVRVIGVPFAPGTEVEVIVREKVVSEAGHPAATVEDARVRMKELFVRLQGRNTEPVGPLRRDELYDRHALS